MVGFGQAATLFWDDCFPGESQISDQKIVGLLVGDIANPFALEVSKAVRRAAGKRGYAALVGSASDQQKSDLVAMTRLERQGLLGLVIATLPTVDSELEISKLIDEGRVPIVLVGRTRAGVDSVSANFRRGGFLATQHLIELGHTRIGFVGADAGEAKRVDRLQGYLEAQEQFGVRIRSEYMVGNRDVHTGPSYTTRETGKSATQRLLSLSPPPSAIFARNDYTALGVIDALTEAGLKVPEQVSVVGFDNLPLCKFSSPPLTTVEQPTAAQAATAVDYLIERIERRGDPTEVRRKLLDCNLVVRESTGRSPGA